MLKTSVSKGFNRFSGEVGTLRFTWGNLHLSNVVLLFLWLLALAVISPFGEFPVNDDWAYSRNVYNLVVKGQFVVDTFPAMNLVSQTLYGSVFVWCFGFSFVKLRMSIFLMCIFSSFYLKKTVQMLKVGNHWFSLFFVMIIFFNPLMLELSFTFMTDMFFLSMLIFAIYFLLSYKQGNKLIHYVLFVFFCVMAVLCRQQALLVSFLSLLLLSGNKNKVTKVVLSILPVLLTWLAHDKYRHYLAEYHIANGINYSDKLIKSLTEEPLSHHLVRFGDSMIVCGLLLLPLIMVLPFYERLKERKALIVAIPVTLIAGYFMYYMWNLYPAGNVTTVLQCGPRIVKIDKAENYSGALEVIRRIQILLGGVSFSIVLIMLLTGKRGISKVHSFLPLLFGLMAIVFFVFISVSAAYFDRYIIPVVLLLGFLLLPAQTFSFTKRTLFMSVSIAVLLYSVAVLEVKDYFRWQEVRWTALNELTKQGISVEHIDGGFEYNAWYKPDGAKPKEGKSWWWVNDDEYVLSKQRLKNYEVQKIYPFIRLIPYETDSIYVLRKKSGI